MYRRSVLIIGATSEIGAAVSKHLASKNMQLFLTGRSEKKLSNLLLSIEGEGHQTLSRDYLKKEQIVDDRFSKEKFNGVVLITPRPTACLDKIPTPEEWRELFECCFIGPLETLRKALLSLNSNCKIVIISGITSKQYYPPLPKFAVLRKMWLAEAKALSSALGSENISVNTVSLGGVWSEKLAEKIEKESQDSGETIEKLRSNRVQNIPLKKYAELSEVATVIEQMLGDLTSHISGQNLVLDGGFTSVY